MSAPGAETARIKLWQCAGCGRIDDPRPCVGICRDEKVEYVLAADHDAALAQARSEAAAMRHVLGAIAFTTPRPGEWERGYRALKAAARAALEGPAPQSREEGRRSRVGEPHVR